MKKFLVVLALLASTGVANADVGPDRNARCKDILSSVEESLKKSKNGQAQPAAGQPAVARPAN